MSKEKLEQLTRALSQSKSKNISEDHADLSSTIDIVDYDLNNTVTINGGMSATTCSWPLSASSYANGNITIGSASGAMYYTNGATGSSSMFGTSPSSNLTVQGDAEFEGSVKIKGRDIGKLFEKIEDRLAILTEPDPEKLKKFAALKKAYDHYKLLEKLIGED
jgi:hypothetical protein